VGDIVVNEQITIPDAELRVSFARSGGPGGQNVNKVETKVEIRWRPAESAVLLGETRERVLAGLARKLTGAGDLIVTSSRTRDQSRNRADAEGKLGRTVARALQKTKPRRRTKPSRKSVENRLQEKKERSRIKQSRRTPPEE
jgi:ribosome-associated protein